MQKIRNMNIFEKRELSDIIVQYNKGNLTKFLEIVKNHCPSVYNLHCASHDGNIDCKGNCTLCWMFALREFAFNNWGVDLSETKQQPRSLI